MNYDYIIVGQGVAGTILSYTLLRNRKSVLVISEDLPDTASMVAAGLYNPITGKRMAKTWQAEKIFPFMENFYAEIEATLHKKLLHERSIFKPFASIEEQNYWVSYSANEEYQKFISAEPTGKKYEKYVHNDFGGFETKRSGNLSVKELITSFRQYLSGQNALLSEKFNYDDIIFEEDHLTWKGIQAKKIIFCEGIKCLENPYFKWLPFVASKGEILTVEINNFDEKTIFNKQVFVLPIGNNQYKVGSTYQWDYTDNLITEEAKKDLCQKLEELIKMPYKIIHHESGIRPGAKDRRPFIGLHPKNKQVGIFNGLGTKGVSMAPYFASLFYDFLESDKTLDKEVNIERYYSLYSQSN